MKYFLNFLFPFFTAVIESESAPEESAANLTFEVEKPQEPIEDVPAAKVEEAESLEAVVNNSETPLEIVQDEPIEVEEKVEEPIEEPAVVSESPAPASAPQEPVMAEEPLEAVAEPVLEQPEPVQVEAEGKNIFKFQTKINFDEKTADLMRWRQYVQGVS